MKRVVNKILKKEVPKVCDEKEGSKLAQYSCNLVKMMDEIVVEKDRVLKNAQNLIMNSYEKREREMLCPISYKLSG